MDKALYPENRCGAREIDKGGVASGFARGTAAPAGPKADPQGGNTDNFFT
jgi:hypothetical protein